LAFGKVLEPNWGTFELAKFIVGVNLATATATFFLVVILYGLSGDENLL
jgi:hypothetical protein